MFWSVAWCTGTWPSKTVDHVDRDHKDNRFWKLKDATYRIQNQNHGRFNGGVSVRPNGTFTARITIDGKRKNLGTFPDRAKAQAAYQTALKGLS